MTLAHPWTLLLLLLIPALFVLARRGRQTPAVEFSDARLVAGMRTGRTRWLFLPRLLWFLAAAVMIVALARPQEHDARTQIVSPGIDIAVALDMSTSMLATDFPPNRFEAAREVLKRFVASRTNDRIALVVFAGEAYTQVPLTFDHRTILHMTDQLEIGKLEPGTAIGMSLVESINRIKDSEAESKIIVLLTDGENNRGRIDPMTATRIAQMHGIRVYTIAMGTQGTPSRLGQTLGGMEAGMDTRLLKEIAAMTGGRFFAADDVGDLGRVYQSIDELEKSELVLEEYVTVKEWYPMFLLLALALFLFGWLLDLTLLRTLP